MSGEALKQEIRKTSDEKAKQVLADARSKANTIIAEAEKEAKEILDNRMKDTERVMDQVEKSEAAKAKMECTKSLLGLQSKYVDDAFREAESKVNSLPSGNPDLYKKALTRFITEALGQLSGTRLVAVARGPDRALVEDVLRRLSTSKSVGGRPPSFSVSQESLGSKGGILVHTEDMRGYYVNTFESRLLRSREELRAKVVEALLRAE